MYAIRGIAVSISVFVIVYCGMSVAVLCTWLRLHRRVRRMGVQGLANLLFAWRMFPLCAALLVTVTFAVPSFLLLEPRSIIEPMGDFPLALALLGTGMGIFGLVNAARASLQAARTVSQWTQSAEAIRSRSPFPVLRIQRSVPAMTAAGIIRPRILLSGSAEFVLNGSELRTALNHEIAHIRRRDNLKKLGLRFVAFPGMRGLEAAWLQASEMAADEAAVSSTADALDLAAALIKLSKLKADEPSPDLTAALVHGQTAMINARIERLIAWADSPHPPRRSFSAQGLWYVSIATIAIFAIAYGSLLADVHQATEWLVR
ncbi:MAG TPA: M48 family metalloprotease [Candidatus Sulfotelmatobacter sp.]|nr:M48 family metalloprotease [Candidatus Sulfotelmatobacter sp.]